jgi:hypothetical protein
MAGCWLGSKDRQIAGYVKPVFRDMDVYDECQDRHKIVDLERLRRA